MEIIWAWNRLISTDQIQGNLISYDPRKSWAGLCLSSCPEPQRLPRNFADHSSWTNSARRSYSPVGSWWLFGGHFRQLRPGLPGVIGTFVLTCKHSHFFRCYDLQTVLDDTSECFEISLRIIRLLNNFVVYYELIYKQHSHGWEFSMICVK